MQRIRSGQAVDSRCTSLKSKTGGVEIPNRLRLGMSKSEVVRALGGPSATDGDVWDYVHEHVETHRGARGGAHFDSANTISISFRDGLVEAFCIWKMTTS
jgi:outer membrane protein assembly factor BamE (lipoprotein component of BamABCDE complex)